MKKLLLLLPFISLFLTAAPAYAFTANLSVDGSGNFNYSVTTSQSEINAAVAFSTSITHLVNIANGYNQYGYDNTGNFGGMRL